MKTLICAAGFALAMAGSAAAATVSFTEGNGQNRALVAGSIDLEDSGPGGFDLGTFGTGDVLGIYGRIVHAVDRFVFEFDMTTRFDVRFDLDGYDLESGGSVAAGFSGLVNQNYVTSGGTAGASGGKDVRISLLDELSNVIGVMDYTTNVTSSSLSDGTIFGDVDPGVYTLVVDGSLGPKRRTPALYDLEVIAQVPLPAAGVLLLAGLGGLGALRKRRR